MEIELERSHYRSKATSDHSNTQINGYYCYLNLEFHIHFRKAESRVALAGLLAREGNSLLLLHRIRSRQL